MSRFQEPNLSRNLSLMEEFFVLAVEAGCTPSQLALAWLLQQADFIIPIPGTTSVEHLEENLSASRIRIPLEIGKRLEALLHPNAMHGHRYPEAAQKEVDTEDVP